MDHSSHYLKGSDKTIAVITDLFFLVAVFGKCVFDLSQWLWKVWSLLMGQWLEVKWFLGSSRHL